MPEEAATKTCRNCGSVLKGPYCHTCGQSAVHLRRPTREILDDALGNVFQWDSRLVITLRLLFLRPGRLAMEWIDGKRARYVPPFRLYIIASFILFLLIGIAARSDSLEVGNVQLDERSVDAMDSAIEEAKANGENLTAAFLQAVQQALADPAGYMRKIFSNLPKAAFLLLPAFALLHMLVNLRHNRFYIDYLVFSLYFHAFAFLLLSLVVLIGCLSKTLGNVAVYFSWLIPIYGAVGFHTFNQQGWLKSILKAVLAFGAYTLILGIGVALFFGVVLFL